MAHVQSKPVASGSKSKAKGKAAAKASPKKKKSRVAPAETAAVEEPAPAQKRGRKPGARGYTVEMADKLCNITENKLPTGSAGWKLVAAEYNQAFPELTRSGEQLKEKFRSLANINPIPTGNAPMDVVHRRALEIKSMLQASVNSMSIDDANVPEALDDDELEEDKDEDEEEEEEEGGESEEEGSAVGDESEDWEVATDSEHAAAQGSSAQTVKFVNPPAKSSATPKTPDPKAALPSGKSPVASGSRPRPKPKQVTPFPLAVPSKKAKVEPASTSKGKERAILYEDDSSGPEFLDNDKANVAAGKKRKAEDEGTMVVWKKPTEIVSVPARGAAACNQETANTLVGQLVSNTNPARMEQMAAARQETSMATALLMGKDTQIAELQRNISNLWERHDCKIRDMRNRHDRELREEREARTQAEHKLAHAQSILTVLNMFVVFAALGGAGLLGGGGLPSALGVPVPASPSVSINPPPMASSKSSDAPNSSLSTHAPSEGAYTPAGPSNGSLQDSNPSGSTEVAGLANNA
ncbi:hypothetical protein FRC07_008424 [Ceratobasidium sp. 392]|nr:hypothetical protein FRC07_008424 [Ceratobasidium sp. 392]